MLNKKRSFISFFALGVIFLFAFYLLYERRSEEETKQNLEAYSKLLSSAIWNFDISSSVEYFTVIMQHNKFRTFAVKNGQINFFVLHQDLSSSIDQAFFNLGLISIKSNSAEILNKDKRIGEIYLERYDTSIYVYANVLIITVLFLVSLWYSLLTIKSKKALEIRVRERTQELEVAKEKLANYADNLESLVKTRTKQLEETHAKLVENAHQIGMSQVATGILHNVGNVLNSVNISVQQITVKFNHSVTENFYKVIELLKTKQDDLANFLTTDAKGKLITEYLFVFSSELAHEHSKIKEELKFLIQNIENMKNIIALQQALAVCSSIIEDVDIQEMIDQAIRINSSSLTRYEVVVKKNFSESLVVKTDRLKLIQILINLISNARQAVQANPSGNRIIYINAKKLDEHFVEITVRDNGVGISKENLIKIFQYGFTTKKTGHGFGLHSSALAAKSIGGNLVAESTGVDLGASFTLRIPTTMSQKETTNETPAAAA